MRNKSKSSGLTQRRIKTYPLKKSTNQEKKSLKFKRRLAVRNRKLLPQ
jgi:hypothetical protein